jgi:hypothetical protein
MGGEEEGEREWKGKEGEGKRIEGKGREWKGRGGRKRGGEGMDAPGAGPPKIFGLEPPLAILFVTRQVKNTGKERPSQCKGRSPLVEVAAN